ncbi:IS3 family transposase [Brevibacillus choshinensis]
MYLHTFSSEDQVKKAVADYIEFYNTDRFQSKLNNLSPVEFRTKVV